MLIKCCGCNISGTWFAGVVLVIAGNSEYVIVIYWLIFNKSWNICKDLYKSVQIRRIFFNLQNKRRVFFRRALFNQLISFSKTEIMTIQFSNNPGISVRICADLYRFAGSAQHGGTGAHHHKPILLPEVKRVSPGGGSAS